MQAQAGQGMDRHPPFSGSRVMEHVNARNSRADLEDRILDVVRDKRLSYSALEKAEKDAGVPSGTKPTEEQLQAVLARLEAL